MPLARSIGSECSKMHRHNVLSGSLVYIYIQTFDIERVTASSAKLTMHNDCDVYFLFARCLVGSKKGARQLSTASSSTAKAYRCNHLGPQSQICLIAMHLCERICDFVILLVFEGRKWPWLVLFRKAETRPDVVPTSKLRMHGRFARCIYRAGHHFTASCKAPRASALECKAVLSTSPTHARRRPKYRRMPRSKVSDCSPKEIAIPRPAKWMMARPKNINGNL